MSGSQKLLRLSVGAAVATLFISCCSLTATLHIFAGLAPTERWTLPLIGAVPVPQVAYVLGGIGMWLWNALSLAFVARLFGRAGWRAKGFALVVMAVSFCVLFMVWDSTRQFVTSGQVDQIARNIAAEGSTVDAEPLKEARADLQRRLDLIQEPGNTVPSQALLRIRRGAASVQAEIDAATASGRTERAALLQKDLVPARAADDLKEKISALDAQILAALTAPKASAQAQARQVQREEQSGFVAWITRTVDQARSLIFATLADLVLFIGFQTYVSLREGERERERIAMQDAVKDARAAAEAAEAAERASKAAADAERDRLERERLERERENEAQRSEGSTGDRAPEPPKDKNRERRGRRGLPAATAEELAQLNEAGGHAA